MADILTLATRVEALDGPDREVDALVGVALGLFRREDRSHGPIFVELLFAGERWPGNGGGYALVPRWTASIDAVVALITEKLPTKLWSVFSTALAYQADAGMTGDKLARAALAVALRALASPPDAISDRAEKENRHGRD